MISKNQIKFIQSLHSKKNRDQEELFIIEGVKLVNEFLLTSLFEIHSVYGTLDFINKNKHIIDKSKTIINEISEEELKKISLQSSPNQILAVIKANKPKLNTVLLNSAINLFLDDIRDPGNLGTITFPR